LVEHFGESSHLFRSQWGHVRVLVEIEGVTRPGRGARSKRDAFAGTGRGGSPGGGSCKRPAHFSTPGGVGCTPWQARPLQGRSFPTLPKDRG
ncbi:hypothetical protein NK983_24620, partial [Salmonella enterica subsp. enterica serovar Typhimurium]|nr:hypothetical protein [Salmonella enterica subsp. enterica serovar Typhimurium]